jgi:hypothetical protein
MCEKQRQADLLEIGPFFALKNAVDICRQFAKLTASVMKCETTNTILTWVLAVLVLAGVLFALKTIFRARELRMVQGQAVACQTNMNRTSITSFNLLKQNPPPVDCHE